MRNRFEQKYAWALLLALFGMMAPMIIATRVFGSMSYLAVLYMVGFAVQVLAMFYDMRLHSFWTSGNALITMGIYALLLVLPILNNLIKGISINIYDPLNSIIKLVNFYLFYLAMQRISLQEKTIYRFMRVVVAISVLICLYSLVFEFREILSIPSTKNTNVLKISSIFSNRNQYSAFLVIAFVANLYCHQLRRSKLGWIAFALQLFGILTSFSRAALLSILIIVALMFLQGKLTQRKVILLLFAAAAGVALLLFTNIFNYILANYVRLENSADSGRFDLWRRAWDVAKDHLFTGVGFYTGVDIAIANGMELTQFHNMFCDLLVDGGVFEVLFILIVMFAVYRRCVKNCKNRRLVAVYRASFFAFAVHACVESLSLFALSYSDTMYTIFYVALPILLSNLKEKEAQPKLDN